MSGKTHSSLSRISGMGGKMRRQNKFKHVILAPFRIMSKARDFYVKGMNDLAGRVSQGGGVSMSQVPTIPRSFSKGREDDEDYRELLRSVSKRNAERQRDVGVVVGPTSMGGMGMRSYSVGVGKIGRIDEDKPCEFEEVNPRVGSLYPRSRSQAVRRRNVVLY